MKNIRYKSVDTVTESRNPLPESPSQDEKCSTFLFHRNAHKQRICTIAGHKIFVVAAPVAPIWPSTLTEQYCKKQKPMGNGRKAQASSITGSIHYLLVCIADGIKV